MKKTILILSLAFMITTTGSVIALSQDRPKPKKDTVNMDTNVKPTQYYAVGDEKPAKKGGQFGVLELAIIASVFVLVIGGVSFFLIKRKKE